MFKQALTGKEEEAGEKKGQGPAARKGEKPGQADGAHNGERGLTRTALPFSYYMRIFCCSLWKTVPKGGSLAASGKERRFRQAFPGEKREKRRAVMRWKDFEG